MKVIKKINNNVALCLDKNNNEVIAFGKGIGFKATPYEYNDNDVERIYYSVDDSYVNLLKNSKKEVVNSANKILEYANSVLNNQINQNVVFTLIDHINFAISRYQQNIPIETPILIDYSFLFDEEIKIGKHALDIIEDNIGVRLPQGESSFISLHILNAKATQKNQRKKYESQIIDDIINIIEENLKFKIDRNGFNYERFLTHLHYLLCRGAKKELIKDDNDEIYKLLTEKYKEIYECTKKINYYFIYNLGGTTFTKGEHVYLILHISRLLAREDCNQ